MTFVDQRRQRRVPCDLPVAVHGRAVRMSGRAADISRSGVRITIPLDQLAPAPAEDAEAGEGGAT